VTEYGGRYFCTGVNCLRWLAIHSGELGVVDDPAGVEHVAVPEPTELGATNLEIAGRLRLHVRDVVDPGIRVGLHAELVGPKGVDRRRGR